MTLNRAIISVSLSGSRQKMVAVKPQVGESGVSVLMSVRLMV